MGGQGLQAGVSKQACCCAATPAARPWPTAQLRGTRQQVAVRLTTLHLPASQPASQPASVSHLRALVLQLARGRQHIGAHLRTSRQGRRRKVRSRPAAPPAVRVAEPRPAGSLHMPRAACTAAGRARPGQGRPHLLQPLVRLCLLVRQDAAVLLDGGGQAGLRHRPCWGGGERWGAGRRRRGSACSAELECTALPRSGSGAVRAGRGRGGAPHRCSAQTAAPSPRWPRSPGPPTCRGRGGGWRGVHGGWGKREVGVRGVQGDGGALRGGAGAGAPQDAMAAPSPPRPGPAAPSKQRAPVARARSGALT